MSEDRIRNLEFRIQALKTALDKILDANERQVTTLSNAINLQARRISDLEKQLGQKTALELQVLALQAIELEDERVQRVAWGGSPRLDRDSKRGYGPGGRYDPADRGIGPG